jgi:hypothetical protein
MDIGTIKQLIRKHWPVLQDEYGVGMSSRKEIRQIPSIPWQAIAGMRDKLIHDYFGVDVELVWDTV